MLPRVAMLLTVVISMLSSSAIGFAGELRQLADEPMAIMFAKDISEMSTQQYVQRMSRRMGVGKRITKMMTDRMDDLVVTKRRDPVIGQLYYLVQGLVPSVEQISFQSVVDEDEARQLVESRRKVYGTNARFEDAGNGLYRITRYSEHESELQPDQQVEEYNREGPGYTNKLEIVERDGKRFQKQSWQFTVQYRYYDQFLYSNRAEDFSEVRLPAASDIYNRLEGSNDFGVRIYGDRIPVALKTMGWTMLNAVVGTQLQQQDNEGAESWKARQAGGSWALSLLKSLMLDVDRAEGDGHLASGRQPIRAKFHLQPRRNSGLIRQLDELGAGRSRFAPLLRDEAAVSVHFCLALPKEGQEAVTAVARWIEAAAGSSGLNSTAEAGYGSLARALDDLANAGTFEVMVRVVHSDDSGSVILTGIQLRDQPDQISHMEAVAQHVSDQAGDDVQTESTQRHGRPLIHLQLKTDDDSPVRISDIWVAQRDGCLWIAMGGEHAHEMIRVAAERCSSGGRAVRARLLTTKIDLAHWMTWPKDDPTGLAAIPEWIDDGEGAEVLGWARSFGGNGGITPTPLLKKVMASRGDKSGWLTLDAGRSGLTAEIELGAPLADWFLARQIDAQEKRMEWAEQQQEEAAERARTKAVETAE